MSPLVQQCQKALNDISTWYVVGLYWVPGHAGIRGNEIANELIRGGSSLKFLGIELALGVSSSSLKFLGIEPALGVSRLDIQNKLNRWLTNQQWARWRSFGDTQKRLRN
jgi:hypothetical protein